MGICAFDHLSLPEKIDFPSSPKCPIWIESLSRFEQLEGISQQLCEGGLFRLVSSAKSFNQARLRQGRHSDRKNCVDPVVFNMFFFSGPGRKKLIFFSDRADIFRIAHLEKHGHA